MDPTGADYDAELTHKRIYRKELPNLDYNFYAPHLTPFKPELFEYSYGPNQKTGTVVVDHTTVNNREIGGN